MKRIDALKSCPCLDDEFFTHLRLVEPDDAEFIVQLRSDTALNKHLSHVDGSVSAQRKWIEQYKAREAQGEEFYFKVRHQLRDLGVVRMYDFQGDSFGWGSWIILPDRPAGLVTYSAFMIYEMGFDVLGFQQSHFEVRLQNTKVIDFHDRSGAIRTTQDTLNQYFIFPKEKWPAFRAASNAQMRSHRIFAG
jgi:hypothetical protein